MNEPGWHADPTGRHEYRWYDSGWTGHVADGGTLRVDPLAQDAQLVTEDRGPVPSEEEETFIGSLKEVAPLAGIAAMSVGLRLLMWLVPAAVLVVIGAAFVDTESTATGFDRDFWLTLTFVGLGVAWFFGFGTSRRLGSVIRGESGILDLVLIPSYVVSAAITVGAVGVAAFSALRALIG